MSHTGLLNIIRRMHLQQKLSIREISRLTEVSQNTVTKHLAAHIIEPNVATQERQSKIDPFAEKLAGWLKTEAGAALFNGPPMLKQGTDKINHPVCLTISETPPRRRCVLQKLRPLVRGQSAS